MIALVALEARKKENNEQQRRPDNAGEVSIMRSEGPRFRFRNDFAQPVIRMDLCLPCMRTALRCMGIFMRTPAGRQALAAKKAEARQ